MKTPHKPGQLRIIGGEWRGRKLAFPGIEGLRPTPDRVRETLFNWLRDVVPGSRCLDLFAGSGALGFEALSRGAAQAVMVDQEARVIAQLHKNIEILHAQSAHAVQADALSYLQGPPQPFDVVFLDPPYRLFDLLQPCCEQLENRGWLGPHAHIYLEAEAARGLPSLPRNWQVIRSKQAGQVGYHLIVREQQDCVPSS
ncbi:MAG: 16S rRNA (guanine(966)-N(2))-methyltransferase RsmD [Gammaproteobacteria bacterium]|nr:16S rRNA (guanine(966)-N(2))-methyltransferase RsmD [Gammaproteobacteria bacterium]